MLETVRIRRAGYSVRIEWDAFIQQYRVLLRNGLNSTREDVKQFLSTHPSISPDNVQYGVSKIYMRDAEKLILDDHLHRVIMQHIGEFVTCSVLSSTNFHARKRYLRLKQGIVKIQVVLLTLGNDYTARKRSPFRHWYREEHRYRLLREAVIALQSAFRGREARKRLGDIPRQRGRIRVKRVQAVKLPVFDLDNPQSLAVFGLSDDDDLER
ncbi:unnamed protein product [Haemonchus placei]|uniref:Myosin motor domain-containing protein n=1 Tax=Haemonchus placei TaxID=6290 RepID=A0A0N4VX97_HAEPC|nr:unnamed protein product [Haemonchus placei]